MKQDRLSHLILDNPHRLIQISHTLCIIFVYSMLRFPEDAKVVDWKFTELRKCGMVPFVNSEYATVPSDWNSKNDIRNISLSNSLWSFCCIRLYFSLKAIRYLVYSLIQDDLCTP